MPKAYSFIFHPGFVAHYGVGAHDAIAQSRFVTNLHALHDDAIFEDNTGTHGAPSANRWVLDLASQIVELTAGVDVARAGHTFGEIADFLLIQFSGDLSGGWFADELVGWLLLRELSGEFQLYSFYIC